MAVVRDTLYQLGDPPLGMRPVDMWSKVRARWTGAKRQPRAGEWYLSGAIPHAYEARADLSMEFHIAELVLTETVPATLRVVKVLT